MTSHVLRYADLVGRFGAHGRPYHASAVHMERADWVVRRMDYLEVFAVVEGAGTQVVRTRSGGVAGRRLAPGEIFLYRPTDETALRVTDPRGLSAVVVMVPRTEWEAFAGFIGMDPAWATVDEPLMAIVDGGDARWTDPFDDVVRTFGETSSRLDLLRFLVDVIPRFVPSAGPRGAPPGAPGWLIGSVDRMRHEENLRAGVPRFVALAHVTPQHLSASVRRYFGTTPTALVTGLRMRHAANLLVTTSQGIGEIALRCGYVTLSHFSNSFRAAHGLSPRAYRARRGEIQ